MSLLLVAAAVSFGNEETSQGARKTLGIVFIYSKFYDFEALM